jgi:hypothetical protein
MALIDIEDKLAEKLPSGVDNSSDIFGVSFLDVFKKGFKGNARKKLTTGTDNRSGFDDGLLLRNAIHYKPTNDGCDLQETLNILQSAKENLKNKVKYLITYDGKTVAARDISEGDSLVCSLADLKHEFFFFSTLYGEPRYVAAEENKADQDAAIALSKVYSALQQSDPEWTEMYAHDVNTFMTRLLFCLFAEDTELFENNIFTTTLVARGGKFGEHAQSVIGDIYRILNTADEQRDGEAEWLCKFPYVNGDVFALDGIHIPKFNIQAFHYLKEAGETIDWKEVHPDILGSALQKITDPAERHSLGMHYTSVTNIDKLLGPLFVDELREARVKANASGVRRVGNLQKLITRIGQIKVFDPACGSGNFLVIAYKRLRELEIQLLNDLQDAGVQQIDLFSSIMLDNFYGIEYADFAAETAKISLRISEQQMNSVYGENFNKQTVCLPLRSAPNIHTGSALDVDWKDICPTTEHSEAYVCGNPPYLGSGGRSGIQNSEQDGVMNGRISNGARALDYVCNWFVLAHAFCIGTKNAKFAFVSTNSITQGSHVPTLWPYLLSDSMEIGFAYPSFKWSNLAGQNAGVSCVILGMQHKGHGVKRLFLSDGEQKPENINPYLMAAPNIWVNKSSKPISSVLPDMMYGSKPVDGGHLHLTRSERDDMISEYPEAEKFIRRLIGSQEMLKNIERYCLWIENEELEDAMNIPPIADRIESNRQMREGATKSGDAYKLRKSPHRFRPGPQDENRHLDGVVNVVIPEISSGERLFIPVSVYSSDEVINNNAYMMSIKEIYSVSILSSSLLRIWQKAVGNMLGSSGFVFSKSQVWNTFPIPELTNDDKESLNKAAQKILNARHYHPDLTLGDMYNPGNMGPELLAAHKANDRVLEKIFRDKPFKNDEDRLAHLFERYAEMTKG